MKTFRQILESDDAMTHEVMTAHGLVRSALGWFAPAHVRVDFDALHDDIVGSGWKHDRTDVKQVHSGYRVSQYSSPTHSLNVNHSINSYGEHEGTQASVWRTPK